MDTVFRTSIPTFPAADTFRGIDIFRNFYAHLAGPFTCFTAHALLLIYRQAVQTEFVEQCVKSTQWT